MDQSTTFSIVTGIVAGLLTSVVLYLAQRIWVGTVLPAWENAIYKDTRIEGRWDAQLFPVAIDPTRVRDLIQGVKNKERLRFHSLLRKISADAEQKAKALSAPEETDKQTEQPSSPEPKLATPPSKPVQASRNSKSKDSENELDIDTFTVTINRVGHRITGYMLGTVGGNKGRNYKICGSFRNLILTATLEPESTSCIERGALCLSLRDNGSTFEGYIATYGDSSHSIAALKTEWHRSA